MRVFDFTCSIITSIHVGYDGGFLFPPAGQVVDYTQYKGGHAGQRVAQPEAEVAHIKGQTKQQGETDTAHDAVQNGDGEIELIVAAAAGKGVHRGAQGAADETDHRYGDILHTDQQDGLLAGEETKHGVWEEENDDHHQGEPDAVDQQGGAQQTAHPIVFAGTDILAHDRAACGIDGGAHQIGEGIHLVAYAGHGRNGHTVAVDPGVDEQLGEHNGCRADGKRNTQFDQDRQFFSVDAKVLQGKVEVKPVAVFVEISQCGQETDGLSDDGSQSGAKGFPAETDHKNQIQDQIQHGGDSNEHKGTFGVTQTAHDGADNVIAIDKYQAEHTGGGIGHGLIPGFGGRIQQIQNLPSGQKTDYADNNSGKK